MLQPYTTRERSGAKRLMGIAGIGAVSAMASRPSRRRWKRSGAGGGSTERRGASEAPRPPGCTGGAAPPRTREKPKQRKGKRL